MLGVTVFRKAEVRKLLRGFQLARLIIPLFVAVVLVVARIPNHSGHGRIDNYVVGNMQVGDAAVRVHHRQAWPSFVTVFNIRQQLAAFGLGQNVGCRWRALRYQSRHPGPMLRRYIPGDD